MIAARRLHLPDPSAHVPFPGLASTVSVVVFTVNVAACAACTQTEDQKSCGGDDGRNEPGSDGHDDPSLQDKRRACGS